VSAIGQERARELRDRIGQVGVWLGSIALLPAAAERVAIAQIEQLGYGAAWFGEAASNREALSHAALLLGSSQRLVIATGIANIWARDAAAAINGANTLNEAYEERFLLGLGVSHAPMLELARERTAGAHPYFVPPSHTAKARAILGSVPLLAPEQVVVLETDNALARGLGRRHMAGYLKLPNYVNNLRALGYDDTDFADGGSERLVDAIVAWGDEEAITGRVREHLLAGADHVAVQAYAENAEAALAHLERLAPALLQL
jgi:luciferase-like monooxygenase